MVTRSRPLASTSRASVSVVIPNYNYGRFLGDAATSALSQDDVDVNVIIIDNASTDNSRHVAVALAEADSRVKCIFRTSNQGFIANFNEGLSHATGEYVVLLCADDLLTPGSLGRSAALLETHPDVAFAYGNSWFFTDELPAFRTEVRCWSIWAGPEWIEELCHSGRGILNPGVFHRRSVISNLRYDATNPHASDFKLFMDATRYGGVGHIDADQGIARMHGENLSRTVYAGLTTDINARAKAFEDFFADIHKARTFANADKLDTIWRRTLASEALDQACRLYDRGRVVPKDVRDLEEFAISICPDAYDLPKWRALSRRKMVGERFSQYVPVFVAAAIRRRLSEEMARRRWAKTGIW